MGITELAEHAAQGAIKFGVARRLFGQRTISVALSDPIALQARSLRFVGRELVAVLNPSKPWGGRSLFVGDVHLGTNRIRVELGLLGGSRPAVLEFEDRSGWLVAWLLPYKCRLSSPVRPNWWTVVVDAPSWLATSSPVSMPRSRSRWNRLFRP